MKIDIYKHMAKKYIYIYVCVCEIYYKLLVSHERINDNA